jgi:hypothetical protein
MLTEFKSFVKRNLDDIILFIGVVLIALFSFALGFIIAKVEEKEPLKIEYQYEGEHSTPRCFIS